MSKVPTILDDVNEKNVIFLIDTSGSMYCRINIVKQHLKECLQKMAFKGNHRFNMVEFNSTVTQWSDKMVQCLPETVTVAFDWINSLEAKTGTNTECALLAAYNDDECDAIYLVTDGLPDSKPTDILDRVAYICNGRPCHCIYLTGATVDKEATNFLQDLATDTYGSFTIVTVTNHGAVDRVTPVYKASHAGTGVIRTTNKEIYAGNQKQCSVTTTLDNPPAVTLVKGTALPTNPYILPIVPPSGTVLIPPVSAIRGPHPGVVYPSQQYLVPGPRVYADENGHVLRVPYMNYAFAQWYQPYLWARYRTARSWMTLSSDLDGALTSMSMSPAAGSLLIDQPVLARRTEDGLYYKGKVKSQISNDRFLVEFAPCSKGDFLETSYQETFVFDIVQQNDGLRHSIMKGDKVLAPTEENPDIYSPATVIDGQEGRESSKDITFKELVVIYTNGRSANIKQNKAIWIDQLLYDRTSFELKLPKKTRQQIIDTVAGYPEDNLPGYPVSGADRDPLEWELPRKYHVTGADATYEPQTGLMIHKEHFENYKPYLKNFSQKSSMSRAEIESKIPGTNLTHDELSRKVGAQIDANRRDLDVLSAKTQEQILFEQRKRELECKRQKDEIKAEEIERDISVLEAELKYKLKLRDQAYAQKKEDIDAEIEIKIKERDKLMEERRLLFGYPSETRLSRQRNRFHQDEQFHSSRSPSETSRERHHYRSRSRSLSTERAPSYGHVSPRDYHRSRSVSPTRSVNFDESLNQHHKYRYYSEWAQDTDDSGFSEAPDTKDSGTNTPILRNGREIQLKKRKDGRPPWKYWRADPVPDLIAPPSYDPYNQGAVAEPLELRDANIRTGVLEWGSSHFSNVVPNGRTNYNRYLHSPMAKSVSFQDNSNVHVAPGSNLVTHISNEEKRLKLRQQESQRKILTMSPSTYYMNGDSVGKAMNDFHKERVVAQMEREKLRQSATSRMENVPTSSKSADQSSNTKTYEAELKATSYQRELNHRQEILKSSSPDQRKIATKSAKRQERDLLQAAKLQQEENNRQQSQERKRERVVARNADVSKKIMSEVAKEKGIVVI